MARETRGAAKAAEVPPPPSPAIKRKRKGSSSPVRAPTVKVVIPPKAIVNDTAEVETNGAQDSDEHGIKRARISLKIKKPEAEAAVEEIPVEEDKPVATPVPTGAVEVKEETKTERALSKEVRDAFAKVVVAMAANLPPPLNRILGLWLPPDFTQKQENTLGYVLRQDTLTWETLVDILHVFSKNLLVPCNYPNPMPSTTQFHLPVPTLPSHYPPHPIYAFCAGLYSVMVQIAPSDIVIGTSAERWGLMQKIPHAPSGSTVDQGDWFTAGVDSREVGGLLEKLKKIQGDAPLEGTLLEQLASAGDRFGYANAIAVQSAVSDTRPAVRTLNDSVVKKASLRARAWKETRAARVGGFGNGNKSIRVPPTTEFSFTPTFGAYFDTNHFFGGYNDTMTGMHERARRAAWTRSIRSPIQVEKGYQGLLDPSEVKNKGKGKETVEDILEENARLIEELQYWQEIRVQKGDSTWTSDREQLAAEELLSSLTRLASGSKPSDFMDDTSDQIGLARRLAQRVLQNNSPSIRGTLDPRRPHAIHDNLTVRPKSPAAQPLGGTPGIPTGSGSSAYPPRQSTMYQPPRQQPSYPSPTPYRPPTANLSYTSPLAQPGPGRPNPNVVPPPQGQYNARPPAAGPSGLRQSFGPGSGTIPYPSSPRAPIGSQRI